MVATKVFRHCDIFYVAAHNALRYVASHQITAMPDSIRFHCLTDHPNRDDRSPQ
jgi:hypothetical protein